MKIEVVSQKKNQLLGREEAEVRISHHGQRTPSRQEMLKGISSALKAGESSIIIDRIITLTGEPISVAKVLAYENKDAMPKYKLEKMKRRMKQKGEQKEEAAKPAEKKKEE